MGLKVLVTIFAKTLFSLTADNGDLHLQFDSPCINAGTTEGSPPDDIDEELRSDGAVDIGADEYVDADSDEIADYADNCPTIYNPDQADFDEDNIGDVCEIIKFSFDINQLHARTP